MGYLSSINGRIDIDPPLNAAEYRTLIGGPDFGSVKVETNETSRDTDDGTLLVLTGTAIVPAWDDDMKAYEFVANVKGAVATLAEIGTGRRLNGVLVRAGEDQGDVERVRVVDNVCHVEMASLTWPDGANVDMAEF